MAVRAPALSLPAPGDVIGGKYKIDRVLGEGGMGIVFEATHTKIGQRVAIKVLRPHLMQNAKMLARFEREARAAGKLRGRHVARVLDVEVLPEKLPYMVIELLRGHDLAKELELRGALPVEDAVDYVLQACAGIAEAHDAGIIHRDLKPSNLFLSIEEHRQVVKLLDFGIAKIMQETSKLTSTRVAIGTLLYMSPEQIRSAKTVDLRTDVWALGVILYELLGGAPPFMGSGPEVAARIVTEAPPPIPRPLEDVPDALLEVINKALAKKTTDRFGDSRELAAALAPFAPSKGSLGRISVESAVLPRRATGEDLELGNASTLRDGPKVALWHVGVLVLALAAIAVGVFVLLPRLRG